MCRCRPLEVMEGISPARIPLLHFEHPLECSYNTVAYSTEMGLRLGIMKLSNRIIICLFIPQILPKILFFFNY